MDIEIERATCPNCKKKIDADDTFAWEPDDGDYDKDTTSFVETGLFDREVTSVLVYPCCDYQEKRYERGQKQDPGIAAYIEKRRKQDELFGDPW